ncbi:cellulase family glycosylhydrolase [Agreia sp. PsM10]|uniref:cellulase family glycosylhydrolase n=1 Tax=Agreia sp. PsM10 TaxID=3030533 RepID=UPI00263B9F32|nr:cellulase family glycosylhydrolase [Agreia sp. PsM10]MDN4639471.1 cellulase family glycosylhydrolase [Agreia sp. PsM10]
MTMRSRSARSRTVRLRVASLGCILSLLVVLAAPFGSTATALELPSGTIVEPAQTSETAVPSETGDDVITAPMRTDGSDIIDSAGDVVVIRAVAWFGMETANCAPHGLWSISLDAGMAQIAAMGFNTVRLPFSSECLAATTATSINEQLNPDLVGLTPLELMDRVVESAADHGLAVMLDRHRPDSGSQSALWYTPQYSEQRWIDDWTSLAERYLDVPSVIAVDLHNEPHGAACWGCGDPATDWQAAATRAGNAVLAVNPGLLIVVEGVETSSDGSSTWWGGGLADVAGAPVILDVGDRVVYSPHDYPASVFRQTWFDAAGYPANLGTVWTTNWGYIAQRGIAPVLVGEFGTKLETASDSDWLAELVDYIDSNDLSFSYWSFNPNSGDTGGLVQDDWVTPQAAKLAALAPLLPNASSLPSSPPTPRPTPSPITTPSPSTTPAPTPLKPLHGSGSDVMTADLTVQSEWADGYVAEVVLRSSTTAGAWTISWSDPSATGVENAWGMSCDVSDGRVTCSGVDWAVPVGAGADVRVGVQVRAHGAPPLPIAVDVRSS